MRNPRRYGTVPDPTFQPIVAGGPSPLLTFECTPSIASKNTSTGRGRRSEIGDCHPLSSLRPPPTGPTAAAVSSWACFLADSSEPSGLLLRPSSSPSPAMAKGEGTREERELLPRQLSPSLPAPFDVFRSSTGAAGGPWAWSDEARYVDTEMRSLRHPGLAIGSSTLHVCKQ